MGGTNSLEQLMRHVRRGSRPLLRGFRVVVLEMPYPRRKIVIRENTINLVADQTVHEIVQAEVSVKDSNYVMKPLMDCRGENFS